MTQQPWMDEFDEKFPAMGRCGDPKDDCVYRFDQYVNDESLIKSFITTQIAAAEEKARQSALEEVKGVVRELKGREPDGYYDQALSDTLAAIEGLIKKV